MDELNREYNPLDEYADIAEDSNKEAVVANTDTPDTADIKEDDVFEAFEKAQNTQSVPTPPDPDAAQYGSPVPPSQPIPPQFVRPQSPYMPTGQAQPQYKGAPVYTQPPQYRQQQPFTEPQYNGTVPPNSNAVPPYQQTPPNTAPQYQQTPPYYNPYAQQNVVKPKEKTPKGTKILIGVLIGLLIIFMIGFFVSCSVAVFGVTKNTVSNNDNPLSQYGEDWALPDGGDNYYEFYGDDIFGYLPNAGNYSGDTFKEKVTLQADEGETQDKGSGANVYGADKDASSVKSETLPKDKNDKKYTTQYAYNTVTDSVVSIACYEEKITDNDEDIIGEGTGTIISSDGYIVTNSHVIGDTNTYKINVVLNNADEYPAKVVGYDTRTDLAVLKIDAKDLTYVNFGDSSLVEVGQDIVAIGNPGGQSFQNSLTKGIVSAVDRELQINKNVTYIQLDAAINPGNSGGPLCNIYGQVIGINTAKIASQDYEGMGFAIPSATVIDIANDLIHYGYVKDRVRLGLMGRVVDDEMASSYSVPYGILITEISEGGPLDNTDIKPYDIVTEINGEAVTTFQDVYGILAQYKPGDKVTLTLYRLEQ